MKCGLLWVFILFLSSANFVQAGVCSPKGFKGFLKQTVFGKPRDDFNVSKYFSEKSRMDALKELPVLPVGSSEETSLAWWESSVDRRMSDFGKLQKARVSIDEIFQGPNHRQKQKLMNWARTYFGDPKPNGVVEEVTRIFAPSKNLTEKEIIRANLELQLILHDSHLNIPRLRKLGKLAAAERWVVTDFAEQVTRHGMVESFAGAGRVEKGNWVKRMRDAFRSSPGKALTWGPMNAMNLTNPWSLVYVYVPERRLFKLSEKQVEDFILFGEKALPETTRRMLAKSVIQSTWNTANEITGHTALFWAGISLGGATTAYHLFQFHERKIQHENENKLLLEEDERAWEEYEKQLKERKSIQE